MAYMKALWIHEHGIAERERECKRVARQRKVKGEISTAEFEARYAQIEQECADLRSDMFREFLTFVK